MKNNQENKKPKSLKTLKYGSVTALMIIIFTVILVFANVFAGYVTDRFSFKMDMTEDQVFSIGDKSKEALKDVDEEVRVYIMAKASIVSESSVIKNAVELIERCNTETGGKISYKFIDPHTNPDFYEKYPEISEIQTNAFIFETDKRYVVVNGNEFAYVMDNAINKSYYETEDKLVSAILYVTSDKVVGAGFVTNHNETDVTMLKNIFTENRFHMEKAVDLSTGVPEDVNNLVIASPRSDFSEVEIENLDKFLSKADNNLYVFVDPLTTETPRLERYLSEWGLSFPDEYVFDLDYSTYNLAARAQNPNSQPVYDGTHILLQIANKDVADSSKQGQFGIISPASRPIERLWNEKSYMRTMDLLTTYETAYGKSLLKEITSPYAEEGDNIGPLTIAAIAEKANGKNGEEGVSRIIAFGSTHFAVEEYISVAPNTYNKAILSSVVSYSNPDTDLIEIDPKVVQSDDLIVKKDDIDMLFWILVVIMPTVILGAGIAIFALRRRK
ncbi:MAG: hypothetical protein E7473_05720 [Ruminococcaceae bacterium]|nr:hypothetical protein [Oscillospiraceae bacterium]